MRRASSKTVPALYPEAGEPRATPKVFATGFLVGFVEGDCTKAINPYLDWPHGQSVGTHIDVSHDGVDLISKGRYERSVIRKDKLDAKVRA